MLANLHIDKRKIAFLGIGFFVIILIVIFLTTSSNDIGGTAKYDGYEAVHEIEGVSFYIPSNVASAATAISEISDNVGIEASQTYIYRNGSDKYVLFNMGVLVVAVQKGTDYNEELSDMNEFNVCGIFFEDGLKKTDNEPLTFNGSAEFTPTSDLFGDYVGTLAIYDINGTQYSIFAGVPNAKKYDDLSDDMKDGLNIIAKGLMPSDYRKPEQTSYEVDVNPASEQTEVKVDEPASAEEEVIAEKKPEESQVSTVETESEDETMAESEEAPSKSDDEPEELPSEESESPDEEPTEEVENPGSEEPSEEELAETEPIIETYTRDKNKAYSSDVYSMLSVGDSGIINEYNIDASSYSQVIINVKRIYKGEEAKSLISGYCKDFGFYNYFEAPVGCTWHVAEYYIKNGEDLPYIDIKLKGIDGNKLVFRGIKYTGRTYDILEYGKSDAFCGPYYAYYAVPNGCKEYALECGTGQLEDAETENMAAYYLIK